MELTDFMARNHTKVYSGYNHQANIAMMSALLLGWKRIQWKTIDLDHLKRFPSNLINHTFKFIDKLDVPVNRELDYNSYDLLDKFSVKYERQVVVLESPMNDTTCELESLSDVPFQVHYSTSTVYGKKDPIVLWETHLIDESGMIKPRRQQKPETEANRFIKSSFS